MVIDCEVYMGGVDLFGNIEKQKALTSSQRLSTRQAILPGRDLYTTDPKDIERFLTALKRDGLDIPMPIWEPAAGRGDISKTLIAHKYFVSSSDIYRYEDEDILITKHDFFTSKHAGVHKTIFTNPPFNAQEEFLEHALSMGVDVVFFVRLSFLSSIRRYRIFQSHNPAYVYVYSARAHCYKDGDKKLGQNMIDYCMMMWKPPYKAETIMRWIA